MNPYIDPIFDSCFKLQPLVLVDVGAAGSLHPRWMAASRNLHVIAFEPDRREFGRLAAQAQPYRSTVLSTALYRERAVVEFHLARKQEASSLLKPNRSLIDAFPEAERFDTIDTVQVETDSLDAQLAKHRLVDVDFIKLDTQGSELSILEGATAILNASVVGLEIEMEFAPLYQGQPLFAELDTFVRKCGFDLFDLRPYYWKRTAGRNYGGTKGQLIMAEGLYLRNLAGIRRILDGISDASLRKNKVLRMISVCILYGYLDYALEVWRESGSLFSAEETAVFQKRIAAEVPFSSRIPAFPGRGRLGEWLYALYRFFGSTSYHGWASAGRALGNSK